MVDQMIEARQVKMEARAPRFWGAPPRPAGRWSPIGRETLIWRASVRRHNSRS